MRIFLPTLDNSFIIHSSQKKKMHKYQITYIVVNYLEKHVLRTGFCLWADATTN